MWLRKWIALCLIGFSLLWGAEKKPILETKTAWRWIGQPAQDEVTVGMWSHHFGVIDQVERHQLVGGQFKGFFVSTLINSHGTR